MNIGYREQKKCRLCESEHISEIWNWGDSPLANAYKDKITDDENQYPLIYFKCDDCHSVQLKVEIDPDILFKNYLYESPPNLIPHFKKTAEDTLKFLRIKTGKVLDIGSNNGLLLKEYQNLGCLVTGIEPAAVIAEKAIKNGVHTIPEFFNTGLANKLDESFDLVVSTNCFAHIPDLNEIVNGIKILIKDTGYFVFENAYLLNTLINLDFGQCYFEHIYMHNLLSLKKFFQKHDLEIFHVEFLDTQMGSIRVYVRSVNNRTIESDNSLINSITNLESIIGLDKPDIYNRFFKQINVLKHNLNNYLSEITKDSANSICVFGWPAKMSLLCKYFGIEKHIDYIIEESPVKIGKFAPGTNLEIKSLKHFKEHPTKYCIIGAYNYEKEIISKQNWYMGHWINPLTLH